MALNEKRLKEAVQKELPVFGFFSPDAGQLEQAGEKTIALLGGDETEVTRLDGPAPQIEEIVLAAGTISFFSTKRIIYLPLPRPSAYKEADFKELCDIFSGAENSVLVLTCQIAENWGKPSLNKAEQRLLELCGKLGMGELLAKPTEAELKKMIASWAAGQGASIGAPAAALLLENCGPDAALLQNEVDKLAAYADYGEITQDMIRELGTRSLDADVFDMAELLNRGKTAQALQKLEVLLRLQNEPIAISAALATGYLDMYRLCAARGKDSKLIAKDFGYRNAFRLTKRQTLASRMGRTRLRECLKILLQLDSQLKSVPDDRKPILMQAALCALAAQQSAR